MKLFDVYPLFDVTIDHGKGCYVYDDKGQEYLDFYGGHAVISIGHCHPRYLQTMQEQAAKLSFYSNAVKNPLQVKLAEKLGKVCGYDDYQRFLINSGAEAKENAASQVLDERRKMDAERLRHDELTEKQLFELAGKAVERQTTVVPPAPVTNIQH